MNHAAAAVDFLIQLYTTVFADVYKRQGSSANDRTGLADERASSGKFSTISPIQAAASPPIFEMCIRDRAEGVAEFKDGEPYITENETMHRVCETIVDMAKKNVCYLANSWSDYGIASIYYIVNEIRCTIRG